MEKKKERQLLVSFIYQIQIYHVKKHVNKYIQKPIFNGIPLLQHTFYLIIILLFMF